MPSASLAPWTTSRRKRFVPSDDCGYDADITQGELEHSRVKKMFAVTNKNKNFEGQIAHQVHLQRVLEDMARKAPSRPREREKAKETARTHVREKDRRTRIYSPAGATAGTGADRRRTDARDKLKQDHKATSTSSPYRKPSSNSRNTAHSATRRQVDRAPSARSQAGHAGRRLSKRKCVSDMSPCYSRIKSNVTSSDGASTGKRKTVTLALPPLQRNGLHALVDEPLGPEAFEQHFQISEDTRNQTTLEYIKRQAHHDAAFKVCVVLIHVFARSQYIYCILSEHAEFRATSARSSPSSSSRWREVPQWRRADPRRSACGTHPIRQAVLPQDDAHQLHRI